MKRNKEMCGFCEEAYKELVKNNEDIVISFDGITAIRFDKYLLDNKYLNGKILALNFHDRIDHFSKCVKNSEKNIRMVETTGNIAYLCYGYKTEEGFNSIIRELEKLHKGIYLSKILI